MSENNEIFIYNKEQMGYIKNLFTPHFNLYQKGMLQEKIDCFEKFYKTPSDYYECIEKIDEKMGRNSEYLQKKFQSIEYIKTECEDKCRVNLASDNSGAIECLKKCHDAMKDSAITIYKGFYDSQLNANPEYKKVKI